MRKNTQSFEQKQNVFGQFNIIGFPRAILV